MKVLHVFKTYIPDSFKGIERVIHSIAEATTRRGLEVDVLTVSDVGQDTPIKIQNHSVYQAKRNASIASTDISLEFVLKLRNLSEKYDIIHYHFPWPMMDIASFFTRGARSIVTYHSDVVKQRNLLRIYGPIRDGFLNKVDTIVATSPNYAKTSNVLSRFGEKTIVIPIGIEKSRLNVDAARDRTWSERLGSGFFLFIGAPRYYKGLPYLLEAARTTNIRLVLIGVSQKDLEQLGGAPPNVVPLGEVEDVDKEAILDRARALILPSHLRSEAFGVVLLEAARAGIPMITCEIGTGTTYVNEAGRTGLVVPPCNPQALSDAMGQLDNPELAQQLGRNAQSRFLELFTDDKMADSYIREYYRLIQLKKQR